MSEFGGLWRTDNPECIKNNNKNMSNAERLLESREQCYIKAVSNNNNNKFSISRPLCWIAYTEVRDSSVGSTSN